MNVEHRAAFKGAVEVRAGGKVGGVAMLYGDKADLGRGVREVFSTGSLAAGDVPARITDGHGGPVVSATPEIRYEQDRVEVEFEAPPEIRSRVSSGQLRHFSIEFISRSERFDTMNFLREIREATLVGVALVPNPAYRQTSAEARADDTRPEAGSSILGLL